MSPFRQHLESKSCRKKKEQQEETAEEGEREEEQDLQSFYDIVRVRSAGLKGVLGGARKQHRSICVCLGVSVHITRSRSLCFIAGGADSVDNKYLHDTFMDSQTLLDIAKKAGCCKL